MTKRFFPYESLVSILRYAATHNASRIFVHVFSNHRLGTKAPNQHMPSHRCPTHIACITVGSVELRGSGISVRIAGNPSNRSPLSDVAFESIDICRECVLPTLETKEFAEDASLPLFRERAECNVFETSPNSPTRLACNLKLLEDIVFLGSILKGFITSDMGVWALCNRSGGGGELGRGGRLRLESVWLEEADFRGETCLGGRVGGGGILMTGGLTLASG